MTYEALLTGFGYLRGTYCSEYQAADAPALERLLATVRTRRENEDRERLQRELGAGSGLLSSSLSRVLEAVATGNSRARAAVCGVRSTMDVVAGLGA